jgi:Ca-activated chloride channel family protein
VSWGGPDVLLGLWAMPLLGLFMMWMLRRRRRAMSRLGPIISEDAGSRANSRHRTRLWLVWLGLSLVVVALAQPRWGYRWQELEREGLSVVVVLDTSTSMAAQDVSPSRMERAQREILDLADIMTGDRVGLVIFAGGAYPRLPLTLDYGALRTVVKQSGVSSLKSQGSDIGAALEAASKLLGAAGKSDRAIILISDGEDQGGRAESVAAALAEDGIRIYTMGVGTADGAPIPMAQGGFKKDGSGDMVLSRLGEDALKRIAAVGLGAYVRSAAGPGDVRAIYEDEIGRKLQRASQGVRRERIWDERYQWPLGLGLFLMMMGFLVRGPRARVHPALGLAALLLVAPRVHGDEGEVARLAAEQVARPDDLGVAEKLGAALFQAGQYNRAEEVLSNVADRATDSVQRDRSRYNAGLAAYRAGRLTEAAEDWQRLLQDGEHPSAQKNLDAVQRELAKRTGQEPPDQDQQKGELGDQGQDGQQDEPPQGGDTGASQGSQDEPQDQDKPQDPQSGDKPPDDGTRTPPKRDTGAPKEQTGDRGEISENDPSEARDTGAEAPAPQPRLGAISEQEAKRLFDGVEEGTPRVVVDPGGAGRNDW